MEKFINVKGFPLVFVQNAAGDKFTVYQDGKEVRGIRSIRIDAGVDEFTTHEIEYVTGATAEEKWEGGGGKSRWIFEDSPQKSANERRKEAIEKAKKFVEETVKRAKFGAAGYGWEGNYTYRIRPTTPDFVVNEDKRTVVALIKGTLTGQLYDKGIAKCAPSDVFNVHIGKAIALGRAYGLDVSEFEQAPQPDEVVPGMKVIRFNKHGDYLGDERVNSVKVLTERGPEHAPESTHEINGCLLYGGYGDRIISDSEAKY